MKEPEPEPTPPLMSERLKGGEPEPTPVRLHSGAGATAATVKTGKGVVFREGIDRNSAKVATAKKGAAVDILSLQRTETGTLRAETAQGWTTAATRDGRELLQQRAAFESREQRVARLSQQPEPEPRPEPEPEP